ncbi:MAG: Snf7 family protein [Candidatus Bathyarchaeia archaeon]
MSRRIIKSWNGSDSIFTRFSEKIRGRKPSLREKVSQAIYRLKVQRTKLENAAARIENHDKSLFEKIVKAQMAKDSARAIMYANECVELRKIAKTTLRCQLALEKVLLRLETIKDFGDVASLMAPVVDVFQTIKTEISVIMPEVAFELSEVGEVLGDIVTEMGEASGLSEEDLHPSSEAMKIIEEANAVAEQKMKEKFPELPIQVSPTIDESLTTKLK